ncbi:unnamed protein product [Amoebophrya sp. A25]|nr:unnamed protein product [Amoebophrya sp. A25]|eukprot:GSA25T00026762001.1
MIFPAHVFESEMPPSDFMLKMKKWVVVIGIAQFLCVLGRIVVGDSMGALCMMFVVSMAYMICFGEPPLHVRWVFMWTFFCFINAGFDFAIAAVRSIHVYQHYETNGKDDLKDKVPVWQIVVVLVVSWLGAISEICGAVLGYKMYQDFQDQEMQAMNQLAHAHGFGGPLYGSFASGRSGGRTSAGFAGAAGEAGATQTAQGAGAEYANLRGVVRSSATGPEPIQPFAGKGHRLSADDGTDTARENTAGDTARS